MPHVELERHDVILAEGLPCESYLDAGNRAMFANYAVTDLHPAFARDSASAWLYDACAPLLEDGPAVDAIRARLHALAGLPPADPYAHQIGELRGWIDSASHELIRGWAWQPDHPDRFVRLEILAGETILGAALASEQRDDVRDAGRLQITGSDTATHGRARCGFTFRPPQPLSRFAAHTIRVRRTSDHAELWNSGKVTIEAVARPETPAATASGGERSSPACFMAETADQLHAA